MEYIKGDCIQFIKDDGTLVQNGANVPQFFLDGTPTDLLNTGGGSTVIPENKGIVTAVYMHIKEGKLVVVEYQSDSKSVKTKLPFKEKNLKLIPSFKPKFVISYEDLDGEDQKVEVEAPTKEMALNSIKSMKSLNYCIGG